MLTRRRADLRQDDRGVTLTELVVGMTLVSIVGAIALNFFVGMSTQANRVTTQTLDGGVVRAAMNQIATALRLADTPTDRAGYSTSRFVTMTSNDVVFFSNVSAGSRTDSSQRLPPTKVEIKLVAGAGGPDPDDGPKLVEYSYAPISSTTYGTSNYPTTATSTLVLLTGVTNTTVFTYCSAATDTAGSCTPATTPDSVAVVQVALTRSAVRGNAAQSVQSAIAVTGAVS